MSPLSYRSPAIEALHRMMSRLADSSLTIDEASLLRTSIHQLMDAISEAGQESIVWPAEERSNRGGPVSSDGESTGSFCAEWSDLLPPRVSIQDRETSGASIPSAVARSV